jgi:hypothetical protein
MKVTQSFLLPAKEHVIVAQQYAYTMFHSLRACLSAIISCLNRRTRSKFIHNVFVFHGIEIVISTGNFRELVLYVKLIPLSNPAILVEII